MRYFVLASICLAALLGGCSGGDDGPASVTPVATAPTASRSVTPSSIPIDLTRADQLYYEGEYEEALTIYSAAAENGDEASKQQGLWAMARIQSRRGDNSAAERTIETLQATELTPEEERTALLLQGKAEFAQGDTGEARSAFESYVSTGGPAWPYAQLFLAQIALTEGKQDVASEIIDQALLSGLPDTAANESLLQLGQLFQNAGDLEGALSAYQRAVDTAPGPNSRAESLWRLAQTAETAGDTALATETLRELVVSYPASEEALEAGSHPLVAANPAVGTRERAMVLLRHGLNPQAETAFQSIVDGGGPAAAEAHYYLGIISERYELWDGAIAHYDAAISLLPAGTNDQLRAQATWDRATVLGAIGRTDEAIAGYAAVADALATHEEADNGMFRAGMMSYQANRPGDALGYWSRFVAVAQNAEEAARANYWLAKASEALGDPVGATAYYEATIAADPLDFYAYRARAVLKGELVLPEAIELSPPGPDWARAEAWLGSVAGPEDVAASEALFNGEPWRRAVELLEAGLDDRADDEFEVLLEDAAGDEWLTYRLVRAISEFDRPWVTSPAASAMLRGDAPPEIFRLVYPLEYRDLAQMEASINGFSPLLLLAVVRQESLYRPDAISVAEAMGLTQVIPSTADGIASQLEVKDFKYTDLLRPRVSLRFGAYYLGTLLDGFGGEMGPALAGYNGGPANAGDWWERGGGDFDLFVESIEFPETRAYVELVLENYARYLYAYGLVDAPSLP